MTSYDCNSSLLDNQCLPGSDLFPLPPCCFCTPLFWRNGTPCPGVGSVTEATVGVGDQGSPVPAPALVPPGSIRFGLMCAFQCWSTRGPELCSDGASSDDFKYKTHYFFLLLVFLRVFVSCSISTLKVLIVTVSRAILWSSAGCAYMLPSFKTRLCWFYTWRWKAIWSCQWRFWHLFQKDQDLSHNGHSFLFPCSRYSKCSTLQSSLEVTWGCASQGVTSKHSL